MSEFRVPKLNNNDSAYVLVEWLAEDGAAVRAGDPLVTVETSKAVEELAAEEAGVLRRLVPAGAECSPGQAIARLLAPGEQPAGAAPEVRPAEPGAAPDTATPGDVVITAPARKLIDELGVSPDEIRALGRKVVRRADLEHLAAGGTREDPPPRGPADAGRSPTPGLPATPGGEDVHGPGGAGAGELITLSRAQRRTAEVVERSRREIPSAFTLMNVDVTDALPLTRDLTRRLRVLVGLPELVVKALGGLLDAFPLFFATPAGDLRARRATAADVGVTVDVGRGLFVPVVRDPGGRSLAEIARDLTGFRRTALEGTFRESDLDGGAITLTLHTRDGVAVATPIVFPGQTCALALTAPRSEVVQDGAGFAVRKICGLGLSYDHRFVNGREAAEFLGAIRAALESPGHFIP
ncbi:2-oxo acid dehydrogenase subunit E2 [Microtetraspora niveoalba]|uniref:2-oxo acid dehydrogenase subunit E2 n=1 Tax=Microtetraspora niveoalba TaxID=46175 RepID=UPI00082FBC6F|nr:2-oxo acid dehydrogenase subunit E2 [Microtetraspora niveoalba]